MLKYRLMSTTAMFAAPGEGGSQEPPPAGGEMPPAGAADNAPPAGSETPPAGADDNAPPAGSETPPPAAAAAKPDWREREIARKHAQLQEKNRLLAEREAEIEALKAIAARASAATGGETAPAAPAGSTTPAASEDAIRAAAAQMRATERFNEQSHAADKAGRERYGEGWKKATDTLTTLGGFDIETMNQILATDDPARVLYELGSAPEKYQDIMALPEHRRFAEMVKLAIAPAAPAAPKPSGAPAPTTPVGGRNRGNPNELSDELSDDEWYRRRAAQKAARFAARQAAR